MELRNSVQAWQFVDKVLEQSKDLQTRFVALQVLEDTIKYRWKALPEGAAEGYPGLRGEQGDRHVAG